MIKLVQRKEMTSEVVIDVQQKKISIALLEDQQLVEYQEQTREAIFLCWEHLRSKG
jgi:ribonuclease G